MSSKLSFTDVESEDFDEKFIFFKLNMGNDTQRSLFIYET